MKTQYLVISALAFAAGFFLSARRSRLRAALGRGTSLKTKAVETSAAVTQKFTPVEQINLYLDAFHFENGNLEHQLQTHHYCSLLNEHLAQCLIYDGTGPKAKMIGIEYLISQRLFQALPEEEKPLWHSHLHEVKSGQLVAPGLPDWAESKLMEKLKSTYGKTWLTWDTLASAALPLGIPKLMMAFTNDGQIHPELLAERDRLMEISTARIRDRRRAIPEEPVANGADNWEEGNVLQVELAHTGLRYRPAE